ncbi:hypothetical protein MYX84_13265 [Acidobacteria bacterium AH-259-O06]|nr:hypothetical protein [Acidobacteria bacterium AH-259-O06]
MRKSAVLLVFLFLNANLCAAGFPQLALGGGYEVVLIVSNKSSSQWDGEIQLLEGNDEPWSTPWKVNGISLPGHIVNLTIPGAGTQKLRFTGDSQAKAGYLKISGQSESPPLGLGLAIQFFYEFKQNDQLIDSTGTPLVLLPSASWAFPVERSSTANTGFAWAPAFAKGPFSISMTLFDEDGNAVGKETLTFSGHLARFFDEVFSGVPTNFLGSVFLESEFDICLTVLRLELTPGGFQLTSVPPDDIVP